MKQCSICKEVKNLSEFFKDKRLSSGYRADCKKCCNKRKLAYAHTEHGKATISAWWKSEKGQETLKRVNRDPIKKKKIQEYHKTEIGKEVHRQAAIRYRQNHTDKIKAHNAIRVEKSRGNIPPASELQCSICSNQASYYHHPDYSKPLEVIPVCSVCHSNIHNS